MKNDQFERCRVKPGRRLKLKKHDPGDTGGFRGGQQAGRERLAKLNERIETLQELLYAEHKHKLLVVLQGMDTSGKDGTLRKVFEGVNPLGVKVASFKKPTEADLDHDFLWRVHPHVPGAGEMVIFNRSHYEDVLVVRVHGLVRPKVWRARYSQINDFERLLADTGTTILKFFLHISKKEQKERLEARLADREKRWKFHVGDLKEREHWDEYMDAYEDAIEKTSTKWAPWFVVPANAKWYRDLVIAGAIVKALEDLDMKFPEPEENLEKVVVK